MNTDVLSVYMAERSGFFNADLMVDESGAPVLNEDGSPMYDREYTAAEFADLFSMVLSNGVRNGGVNLKVMAEGGSMNIRVLPGDAMIEGYFYKLTEAPALLNVNKVGAPYARKDLVVLRLDLSQEERRIYADIKRGVASYEPLAPDLERSNELYEIALAEIAIYSNTSAVSDSNITDLRLNSDYCGLIHSLVEIDTAGMLNQIDAYIEEKKLYFDRTVEEYTRWFEDQRTGFDEWFEEIKVTVWQGAERDFDNWANRAGCVYQTVFQEAGIVTFIKVKGTERLVAKKTIWAEGNKIYETLWFSEPPLHVKRTTQVIDDGSGRSVFAEIEGVRE